MHVWYTNQYKFCIMLIDISQEGNSMITQELKDRLIADYPKFEDMTHKFYKKEMSIARIIKVNLGPMVVTPSAVLTLV